MWASFTSSVSRSHPAIRLKSVSMPTQSTRTVVIAAASAFVTGSGSANRNSSVPTVQSAALKTAWKLTMAPRAACISSRTGLLLKANASVYLPCRSM